ncbi:MAG: hypothetical protein AAFY98_00200 [Verrucomicrobiota bacterium]
MELKELILEHYSYQLRENAKAPESVPQFCREMEISEREFYQNFASFDVVEKSYWRSIIKGVIEAIESGDEFAKFSAQQRLLTFYYAFNEAILDHRSNMLTRFKDLDLWKRPVWLKGFEEEYRSFIKRIIEHGRESGEVAGRGKVSDVYPDGFYLMFRSIIDFNLKDDSEQYERTDAYIEKSVKLAFDVVRTQALDSAIDLARFLVPDMKWKSPFSEKASCS